MSKIEIHTGQGESPKAAQTRTDGDKLSAESQAEGHVGVKAKIRDQVLKHVVKQGQLLMHWKRQSGTGDNYPYIFPLWLSIALQTDLETVCDVMCEMIDNNDISTAGNIPKPITAAVLVQHVERWEAVGRNPAREGKIESKLRLMPPFTTTVKTAVNRQAVESMLL